MQRVEFRARLQQKPLLLDGAFGTVLHSRGIPIDQSFDAVNLNQPEVVAGIHWGYIDAGANVLETNTFGANHFRLIEHGLQQQVREINQAAVRIARQVISQAFERVLLAGAVGPLGVRLAPLGRVTAVAARAAFREQIEALVTAEPQGVDLLVLETMSDMKEMETAVQAARSVAPDMPIIAMMSFTRDDRTLTGGTPIDVAARLAKLDVDALGVNCSTGPAQALRLVALIKQVVGDFPIAVSPNAGWPEHSADGRVLYTATPAYFGEYARSFVAAGARIVGGCCGTTAAHIAAMRSALDTPGEITRPIPQVNLITSADRRETAVVDPPTQLATDLSQGRFVVTVEMHPPKGIATQRLLAGAHTLRDAGATMLNIADTPLARMRMSAWAAAYLVQKEVGLETVLHFPTRGRNLLRIQGDLLAAHSLGIRNLFITMGDPTRIGDYPEAMDAYDIVSTGLIQLISKQLNRGVDKAGNPLDQPTNFTAGCAVSLTPKNVERELALLHKKVQSGADFALTQPIFDPEAAKEFLNAYETRYGKLTLPIIAGIKPLFNSRNAEFLHHEVPGIHIPTEQRKRIREAKEPQKEGVRIAQELLGAIRPFTQGVYLMPAFGRYDLIAEVIDKVAG